MNQNAASVREEMLISADSHVAENPHLWETRLPQSLRDQAPRFPERGNGGAGSRPGGWDPNAREREMATDGVSAEVLYPSLGLRLYSIEDPTLQEACFRVYNDWLMEYCAAVPERLLGGCC